MLLNSFVKHANSMYRNIFRLLHLNYRLCSILKIWFKCSRNQLYINQRQTYDNCIQLKIEANALDDRAFEIFFAESSALVIHMLVTLIIFTKHLREYESTRTRTWCRWQWRQRKRHGRPCRGRWPPSKRRQRWGKHRERCRRAQRSQWRGWKQEWRTWWCCLW